MGGARPRSGRRPGRSAAVRQSAGARYGAGRAIAADAARRTCGGGLSALVLVAQGSSGLVHARAPFRARILRSEALRSVKNGERVTVAGLVLVRQRPGTASGVIFMTLEDETGVAIHCLAEVFERLRAIVLGARFVAVTGKLQSEQGVIHIVAERMDDLTPMLGLLSEAGQTISALAHAAVRRPHMTMAQNAKATASPTARLDDPRAPATRRSRQSTSPRRCPRGGISVDRQRRATGLLCRPGAYDMGAHISLSHIYGHEDDHRNFGSASS